MTRHAHAEAQHAGCRAHVGLVLPDAPAMLGPQDQPKVQAWARPSKQVDPASARLRPRE